MKNLIFIAFLLISLGVSAQEIHSKAFLIQDHSDFASGMKLGVRLELEKDWHSYWENPGDVGAPPQLQITSSLPISQSPTVYSIPTRIRTSPYDSYAYENKMMMYKVVHLDKSSQDEGNISLKIQFDWLVCNDVCIPCSKTFDLDLPISNGSRIDDKNFAEFSFPQFPADVQAQLTLQPSYTLLTITSDQIKDVTEPDFFPSLTMQDTFNKFVSKEVENNTIKFYYKRSRSVEATIQGLLKLDDKRAIWVGKQQDILLPDVKKFEKVSILYMLLLAFLGGILLNLMPCVLPVVSLKLLSILKGNQDQVGKIRRSNLVFAAGICTSLLVLAIIFILIRAGGQELGWGFQLQSPAIVTFLALLFFLIGLNLIGFFEVVSIPIHWLSGMMRSNVWTSDFLAGFFTTIVATPCTAPFMAVAIGYALTQAGWMILLTFLFLGIGISFPYLLLATFPQLARFLPRPGKWMVTLKEILAFPMFLTVVWLVWVLAQLTNSQAILTILASFVLLTLMFWVNKNFPEGKQKLKTTIVIAIGALAIFTAYQPLLNKGVEEIEWEAFDPEKVTAYAKNNVVFINFTADWCLTCKTNEQFTFSNDNVVKAVKDYKIKMIKADWTKYNPEITAVLQRHNRAGVPLYLFYKPTLTTPMVLPTLLTPTTFINAVTEQGEQP